jgi:hypothetical protein
MSGRDLLVGLAVAALLASVWLATVDSTAANAMAVVGVVLLIGAFIVELRNWP